MKKSFTWCYFFLLTLCSPAFAYDISGTVSGAVAEGVTITLTGTASDSDVSAVDGTYSFTGLSAGTYYLRPSINGYIFQKIFSTITVTSSNVTGVNFVSEAVSTGDATLTAAIETRPSTTVEVGQEIYFSATGSTLPSDEDSGCTGANNCAKKVEYRWDFGDNSACQKESGITGQPYYNVDCKGLAVTHHFMSPGTYTVRLNAFIYDTWTAGTAVGTTPTIAAGSTTATITVTGTAPLAGFEIQRANMHNRSKQYLYIQIPSAHRETTTQLKLSLIGDSTGTTVLQTTSNLAAEVIYLLDHSSLSADSYVFQAQLLDAENAQITGGLWREKFTKGESAPTVTIDENNAFRVSGSLFFPVAGFLIDASSIGTYVSDAAINSLHVEGYAASHTSASWGTYLNSADSSGLKGMGPGRGSYQVQISGNYWEFNHDVDVFETYISDNKTKTALFGWNWQDEPNLGGEGSTVHVPIMGAWGYVVKTNDSNHPSWNLMAGYNYSPYYGSSALRWDYLSAQSKWMMGGKGWVQDVIGFDAYIPSYRMHASLNRSAAGPVATYLTLLDNTQTYNKSLIPVIPTIQPCSETAGAADGFTVSEDQLYNYVWLNIIHGAKGIVWFNYFDMAGTGRWDMMKTISGQMDTYAPIFLLAPVKTITRTDKANAALDRVDAIVRDYGSTTYVFAARVTEPAPLTGIITATASLAINNAGSGYVGDESEILTLAGGSGGMIVVNGVDGGGAITSFYLKTNYSGGPTSSGYSVANNIATTSNKSGTNATFNITAVSSSAYTGEEPDTLENVEFTISGMTGTVTATKINGGGTVSVVDGVFSDTFTKDMVEIYEIGDGVGTIRGITASGVTIQ